jgi:hypothetical protein
MADTPREPPSTADDATSGFRLRTLADTPVDDDLADRLGYKDIADGLALLVAGKETATPLTIAVSAPWGAGKTSLLRLVENRVVQQQVARRAAPAIVVWFNAWMHDAAPNLSAALAADIARHATRCRDPLIRLWHPLPSSMLSPKERARRRFWLGVVAIVSALAIYPIVSSLIGPKPADVTKVRAAFGASAVGWFALLWGVSVLWPRVQRSVAAVAAFVEDPRAAAATGSMTEVAAQLGELIQEAREGVRVAWNARELPRFVVVVDDLERCQLQKAVDVCEVAAQLLDQPGVITVLVGDLRVIAASAELKYQAAAEQFGKDPEFAAAGLGRFFLQKVVQFELELPPVPRSQLRQLARSAPVTASIHGSATNRPTPIKSSAARWAGPAWLVLLVGLILVPGLVAGGLRSGLAPVLIVVGIACGGGVLGASLFALAGYRNRRIVELRDEVDRLVDNITSQVVAQRGFTADGAELETEVLSRLQQATEPAFTSRRYWGRVSTLISPDEVRRRLQLRATNDEQIRARAEKVILDLLPPLPRMAKRLLNRLYFLLVVAYNRNLISSGAVSPEQLGKWAVLLDRWPEAGRAIVKNPGLTGDLEAAAGQEDVFASLCTAINPPLASDLAGLRALFRTSPELGPVAYRLVYLDADAGPYAQGGGADADAEPAGASGEAALISAQVAASGNGRPDQAAPVR